eukprot:TRINITY_DN4547_c0_g1_i1.p1 TRINITY_DN4547_c0_g1~~TRINITY_DN4547_c0_g1_i1.p1  ORF type:complete len:135 (-),score=16.41 TRINITY_DN4547_c0_g1_i1:124-528(-)
MSSKFSLRARKVLKNPLLSRTQMVLEVTHQGAGTISKKDLTARIAETFKIADPRTIFLFNFHTQFGGGRSTGFCLIYDDVKKAEKYEPKYRLIRAGLKSKESSGSRKQKKEKKNRLKKLRATAKAKGEKKKKAK